MEGCVGDNTPHDALAATCGLYLVLLGEITIPPSHSFFGEAHGTFTHFWAFKAERLQGYKSMIPRLLRFLG